MNRFASENTLAHAIKTAAGTRDVSGENGESSTSTGTINTATASSSSSASTTEQPPVSEAVTPVANRRQRGSQRTAALASSGTDGAGAGTSAAASQQASSSSARATGSGNSFRDWQETNQWNTLIASLTMPRPPSPDIGNTPSRSTSLTLNALLIYYLHPYLIYHSLFPPLIYRPSPCLLILSINFHR